MLLNYVLTLFSVPPICATAHTGVQTDLLAISVDLSRTRQTKPKRHLEFHRRNPAQMTATEGVPFLIKRSSHSLNPNHENGTQFNLPHPIVRGPSSPDQFHLSSPSVGKHSLARQHSKSRPFAPTVCTNRPILTGVAATRCGCWCGSSGFPNGRPLFSAYRASTIGNLLFGSFSLVGGWRHPRRSAAVD